MAFIKDRLRTFSAWMYSEWKYNQVATFLLSLLVVIATVGGVYWTWFGLRAAFKVNFSFTLVMVILFLVAVVGFIAIIQVGKTVKAEADIVALEIQKEMEAALPKGWSITNGSFYDEFGQKRSGIPPYLMQNQKK